MIVWLVGKQRRLCVFTVSLMTLWGILLLFLPSKVFAGWGGFRSAGWLEQLLYGELPVGVAVLHLLAMAVEWRNILAKVTIDGQGVCVHSLGVCWFYASWNQLELSLQYGVDSCTGGDWPGDPELIFCKGPLLPGGRRGSRFFRQQNQVIVDFSEELWRQVLHCCPDIPIEEVNPRNRPPGFRWPR